MQDSVCASDRVCFTVRPTKTQKMLAFLAVENRTPASQHPNLGLNRKAKRAGPHVLKNIYFVRKV